MGFYINLLLPGSICRLPEGSINGYGLCTVYTGSISCFTSQYTVSLHSCNSYIGCRASLLPRVHAKPHLLHIFPFFFAEQVLRILLPAKAFFKAVFGTQPGRLVNTFLSLKYSSATGTAIQQ